MNFLALFLLFSNCYPQHPIHLTVTNIEYNIQKKEFELLLRFFVDDFENVINNKYSITLNIGKKNENIESKSYISKYIFENLILTLNNTEINPEKYKFINYEIKDISIWIKYKIKYKENLKNCKITNSLMFEMFPDQKNMLIFNYKESQKSLEFYTSNKTQFLTF